MEFKSSKDLFIQTEINTFVVPSCVWWEDSFHLGVTRYPRIITIQILVCISVTMHVIKIS